VLNKTSGKSSGLTQKEVDSIHEILTWGRQAANNKVLSFFGTVFENFHKACQKLMGRFKSVLPEGCLRARIRATRRESPHAKEGTLADTLGDESHGLIVVDRGGIPVNYSSLDLWEQIVASQHSRLEVEVPTGGQGWSRTGSSVDVAEDPALDSRWQRHIQAGAQHLREETYVRFSEPHMDAKLFPHVHPYGTGSLLSELGSGSPHRHAKNRLLLIQSWFRRSALWGFWPS
jgi:hypothetical protein